ncbi:MAG: cobalt-precorrin-6A reductase [Synechococcales cyanobacterium]
MIVTWDGIELFSRSTGAKGEKRILILGGTGDGVALAIRIAAIPGVTVITSLAGRVVESKMPTTHGRVGGFGGVAGLVDYLQEQQIDGLIDATHPFACQIKFNGVAAAREVGIPHLILLRPPWKPQIEGEDGVTDHWIEVDGYEKAVALLPQLAQRVFLTIGRQSLPTFASLQNLWFLMRMIDPPPPYTPIPMGKVILERGPFSLAHERSLLQDYKIDVVVSKNSGGEATYAKLIAARELGMPVVMIQRPPVPVAEIVTDVESAVGWLTTLLTGLG